MKASSAEVAAAVRVRIAGGLLARGRGLLGCPDPLPGAGLLLAGVRAVHGFGLRRPLDLAYLDAEGRVLACGRLSPWGISRCRGACHVIELSEGECDRLGLVPGRPLAITVVDDIFGRPSLRGRRAASASPRAASRRFAWLAVAVSLAVLAWPAPGNADAQDAIVGVAPAVRPGAETRAEAMAPASSADTSTVDRHVGEPRRKRVRKARASVHRDAADGAPAKPLRKARPRRSKDRQATVEYLVGEPGRNARPREPVAKEPPEHAPDRRR